MSQQAQMSPHQREAMVERYISAWNSQKVGEVLDFFTPDATYVDPSTGGAIEGAEAVGCHFRELFSNWQTELAPREGFSLKGEEGIAELFTLSFRRPDGKETVEVDGIELVLMEGGLVKRMEIFFDISALVPLMT